MASALHIPRVFPRRSCYESTKAIQFPHPGLKIADQSKEIPPHARLCPRGHPQGMAAERCITSYQTFTGNAPAVCQNIILMPVESENYVAQQDIILRVFFSHLSSDLRGNEMKKLMPPWGATKSPSHSEGSMIYISRSPSPDISRF